jgi:hypothetical protein
MHLCYVDESGGASHPSASDQLGRQPGRQLFIASGEGAFASMAAAAAS